MLDNENDEDEGDNLEEYGDDSDSDCVIVEDTFVPREVPPKQNRNNPEFDVITLDDD